MRSHAGKPMQKAVVISWAYPVPRSQGLADALGGTAHYIEALKGTRGFLLPLRYVLQTFSTWRVLAAGKPEVVIAMNPPIVLPIIVWLYAVLSRAKFVIDSHTGAFAGPWSRFIGLHKFLSRRALATVVTNRALAGQVESWGARAVVLEDRLPDLPIRPAPAAAGRPGVCVINSFSDDEPLAEILAAARELPAVDLFVTGKVPKGARWAFLDARPANVILTGFLPKTDYEELLNRVDLAMVLVKVDLTLLCGAYEAVQLGKPLITSNWPVLRDYFSRGCLYVDNSPAEIVRAVRDGLTHKTALAAEMKELKGALTERWTQHFNVLVDLIDGNAQQEACRCRD